MKIFKAKEFKGKKAWDSKKIAEFNGTTVKLHWTNKAYQWHINDGEEVFVVLDGCVEMHTKNGETEEIYLLNVGDIFYANVGCIHFAKPLNEARILVIEKSGSI